MLTSYSWQVVIGTAFLVAYAGLVWWARAFYIVRMNQEWTAAHGEVICASLNEPSEAGAGSEGHVRELMSGFSCGPKRDRRRVAVGWSGAAEIATWVRLHEAKRLEVWRMRDEEVWPKLGRLMGQLDELAPDRGDDWKARYRELAAACPPVPVCTLRANLVELMAEVHNARDGKYSQLAMLNSKANWLILCSLLPLAVLVAAGHGVILLAGAVGGLVSRLQRIVFAEGLPTAYGSSWAPLFCAPPLGALAAWAGLHAIAALQALGVVDLARLLPVGTNLAAPTMGLVGVAVLLGLSERFLNQIGNEADKKLAGGGGAVPSGPKPAAPRVEVHGVNLNGQANGQPVTASTSTAFTTT